MSLPNPNWSVVFGEIPSAAKWSQLGENDDALADGTGLDTNAVGASKLATSAIYLGGATRTSNFTTASATAVQVTDITAPVTVPAGSRKVIVQAGMDRVSADAGANIDLIIWQGTVGSGTAVARQTNTVVTNGFGTAFVTTRPMTVSAGAVTYNLSANTSAGTATLAGGANSPIWIAVYLA